MLLVVDVGNTHITLGAYRDSELACIVRMATRRDRTADEYALLVRDLLRARGVSAARVKAVAICSVVPPLMGTLEEAFRAHMGLVPFVINGDTPTGLRTRYDDPRTIGADRIVDAVAAWRMYGAPVITVDLGTASTLNAVSAGGVFLGGAIAPGIGTATEALFRAAAKLPRIDLVKPKGGVIGKNTVASMQAGILYGYAGGIDALVERMRAEMGEPDARVVATGGFAELIAAESATIDTVNPHLTLDGCRLIWEMNQAGAA